MVHVQDRTIPSNKVLRGERLIGIVETIQYNTTNKKIFSGIIIPESHKNRPPNVEKKYAHFSQKNYRGTQMLKEGTKVVFTLMYKNHKPFATNINEYDTEHDLICLLEHCLKDKYINNNNIKQLIDYYYSLVDNQLIINKYGLIKDWDVSNVTNMRFLFENQNKFNDDISTWDVSNVTDMEGMFWKLQFFNCNLNTWNVSRVKNMQGMFGEAHQFNQPLDKWNISNVTLIGNMFCGATSFNQPLNNWNVSNVLNMQFLFGEAHEFNQPLNNWNLSKVTSLKGMFANAKLFNQPLDNWNISNVTDMEGMFFKTNCFNQPLNNWNTSNVIAIEGMFDSSRVFNQPLNNWDVSKVKTMGSLFFKTISFNQPLNDWNVSNVTNMNSMFDNAKRFNQSLNNWNVSNVLYMNNMFCEATSFNQPLDNWNVNNLIDIENIFYGAISFNNYLSLQKWNIDKTGRSLKYISDISKYTNNSDNTNNSNNSITSLNINSKNSYLSSTNSDNVNNLINDVQNLIYEFGLNMNITFQDLANPIRLTNIITTIQSKIIQDKTCDPHFNKIIKQKLDLILKKISEVEKYCDKDELFISEKKLSKTLSEKPFNLETKIKEEEEKANRIAEELIREECFNSSTKTKVVDTKQKKKKKKKKNINNKIKSNNMSLEITKSKYNSNKKTNKLDINKSFIKVKKTLQSLNLEEKLESIFLENEIYDNALQFLDIQDLVEIGLNNNDATRIIDEISKSKVFTSKYESDIKMKNMENSNINMENSNIKNSVTDYSVEDSSIKLSYKMNNLLTSLNIDKNIGHIFLKEEIDEKNLSFLTISDLEDIGISKNIAQKILNKFHSYEETKTEEFSKEKVNQFSSYEEVKTEDIEKSKNIEMNSNIGSLLEIIHSNPLNYYSVNQSILSLGAFPHRLTQPPSEPIPLQPIKFNQMEYNNLQSPKKIKPVISNKVVDIIESKNTIKSINSVESTKSIPDEYICPITLDIMTDPVMAIDGFTYERSEIEDWFRKGNKTSPKTNETLNSHILIPNKNLKILIEEYKQNSC